MYLENEFTNSEEMRLTRKKGRRRVTSDKSTVGVERIRGDKGVWGSSNDV
jgi:hypothetical protein